MGKGWKRWLGRRRGEDAETLRGRFERFRHLIQGNNRVLGLMADAGEKLGGDYLFDRRYLEWLVDELEQAVEGVVYDLNAMTEGRHMELVEAFERIRHQARAALSPTGVQDSELILPLDEVALDAVGAAGRKMAVLGELRSKLDLPVPEGFVVTASACRRHFQRSGLSSIFAAHTEELQEGEADTVEGVARRLQGAIQQTPLDREVARALTNALQSPRRTGWMYAVRSSALGEDGAQSFAGQHLTLLNVRPEDGLEAYLEVLASLFSPQALRYRLDRGLSPADALMAVGFVAMVAARAAGVLQTINPAAPDEQVMIASAAYGLGPTVAQGSGPVDRFEVSRDPTPRVLSRSIARKQRALEPARGGGTVLRVVPEHRQRVPSIPDEVLAELARLAHRIERRAGHHQEVEWAVDGEGRIFILQARPLRLSPRPSRARVELSHILSERRVLLRGRGTIACRGIGAGPVVVVHSTSDALDFPFGSVLLAQTTSPRLSLLLPRANAVITEVGSSSGHLAAVARELRVPMLVDVGQATELLQPGAEVTVDAEENVVYEGVVGELLQYQLSADRSDVEFEEFLCLRRVLKNVAPLHLSDPEVGTFRPRSCRTYNDIVRFAHEMAVRELVDMPGLVPKDRKRLVRCLKLDIPMDLDLLDLGGGLELGGGAEVVDPDGVRSKPLSALLKGLCAPGTWRTEPVDMDMQSFLSSATRAGAVAVTNTRALRPNLAVISEDYMNLHLMLGYHFNMVDAHLSDEPASNYIYFRFTGGVTDITRRSRRARLIATILEEYDFGVETKGDLVVARLRNAEPERLRNRLEMIGRLIGFTRQLDVLMRDEGTVLQRAREFVGHDPLTLDAPLETQEG